MFDGFAGRDLEDAVAVVRLQLVAIQAVGEAEAAAPGPAAEFAQQRCVVVIGLGCWSFGADHQVAVGGLDVDGLAVDARQFKSHRVARLGLMDFGVGYPLGRGQLLIKSFEQIEGGGMQGQHDCDSEE